VAGHKTVYGAFKSIQNSGTLHHSFKSGSLVQLTLTRSDSELIAMGQNNEVENKCMQLLLHSEKSQQFSKGWSYSQQDCINFPEVKGRTVYYSQRDSIQTPGKDSHTPALRKEKKETDRKK